MVILKLTPQTIFWTDVKDNLKTLFNAEVKIISANKDLLN